VRGCFFFKYYLSHHILFSASVPRLLTLFSASISFLLSSSMKDVCSAGMNIDQSFHAPANEALHTGVSSRRTDKMSGKDKDAHSLRDDLYLKQGHQTDLLEALELRRRTMIDNGKMLCSFCS
jgi:hypothetical protein